MQSKLLLDGAISGAIAGGVAEITVGFKEGIVGGAIGGMLSNGISYGLNKAGFTPKASSILAFAITALSDIGFLHSFGTTNNALIPYTTEDNLLMHHFVFYLALALSMAALSAYRSSDFSFFAHKPNTNKESGQQIPPPHSATL